MGGPLENPDAAGGENGQVATIWGGFGSGDAWADIELSDLLGAIDAIGVERIEPIEAGDGFSEAFGKNEEMAICPEERFAVEYPFFRREFGLFRVGETKSDVIVRCLAGISVGFFKLVDGEVAARVFEISEIANVEIS